MWVTILVNWVLSRILSYDILFLGSNLKTTYFVLKVVIPSDRGWNYESNSVKKLIFDQKSSYGSCKLSQQNDLIALQHAYLLMTSTSFLSDRLSSPAFPLAAYVSWYWSWEKEGRSSWSGPWHLGCALEVFHMHSYQDQFIQPVWADCLFVYLA